MSKIPNYITKIDLRKALEVQDTKARKYRDEILTKMDKVIKELRDMREENTIGAYHAGEVREQVEDHEKRIAKLEAA
ncbi:MAG: hypothetical protein US51_C0032G0003 [Microgenomates group bacterium GW2011_GWA2_37_6]|nr:MAG: hypothetical protein US51_C0032G0003 [Microgenomates group bacterium GW2011_GWA2_37_6]